MPRITKSENGACSGATLSPRAVLKPPRHISHVTLTKLPEDTPQQRQQRRRNSPRAVPLIQCPKIQRPPSPGEPVWLESRSSGNKQLLQRHRMLSKTGLDRPRQASTGLMASLYEHMRLSIGAAAAHTVCQSGTVFTDSIMPKARPYLLILQQRRT